MLFEGCDTLFEDMTRDLVPSWLTPFDGVYSFVYAMRQQEPPRETYNTVSAALFALGVSSADVASVWRVLAGS